MSSQPDAKSKEMDSRTCWSQSAWSRQRKIQLNQKATLLNGIQFDLENALSTVQSISDSETTVEECCEMLRNCIFYKQQLDLDSNKVPDVSARGRSKSLHDVTSQSDDDKLPQ
ncbi:hypothetical protein DICVIV_02222 [Dictyocaulus viviparus]|uniref:Uncharacterized protein n=1 Tax=Dictyocaulus viviparus TaxID=29172 RepID=A0A0D8Y6G8_DICVI|nr:hypothetical protein DICVIV_02222 [Dictyocaulus viviparus]